MFDKEKFYQDLSMGERGERIVLDTFQALGRQYEFKYVADQPKYRYKGDIIAVKPDGTEIFIEVKNDSCIHKTDNVYCEEYVDYRDGRGMMPGNMFCKGDIFAVVSEISKQIYIIDYKKLREIYERGQPKDFDWISQASYGYLVGYHVLRNHNALIGILNYETYEYKTFLPKNVEILMPDIEEMEALKDYAEKYKVLCADIEALSKGG